MNNLFDAQFTFNSSGSMHTANNFKVFYDQNGRIIDRSSREFGTYNKLLKIEYIKLFYIKKYEIGLGDIIDFFTKKLYIKNLIMYLTNGNCGCEERRKKFNKWIQIPYWFKFGSRKGYYEDEEIIEIIKNIRRKNIKLPTKEIPMNIADQYKSFGSEGSTGAPVPVTPPVQPVSEQPPKKGGCGCGKR